jgi:hypothetical protein
MPEFTYLSLGVYPHTVTKANHSLTFGVVNRIRAVKYFRNGHHAARQAVA